MGFQNPDHVFHRFWIRRKKFKLEKINVIDELGLIRKRDVRSDVIGEELIVFEGMGRNGCERWRVPSKVRGSESCTIDRYEERVRMITRWRWNRTGERIDMHSEGGLREKRSALVSVW